MNEDKIIIDVYEGTPEAEAFTALERSFYEMNQSKFIIDFILEHPDLKDSYDFYWGKYIDYQIKYEKQKVIFEKNIILPKIKNNEIKWFVNFERQRIEIEVIK